MCGIAGIHRLNDAELPRVEQAAAAMLRVIASRGRDATGALALHDEGEVALSRGCVPVNRYLAKAMLPQVQGARTVLLHTRFATVGDKHDVRNSHPVSSGRLHAIHNGTIWNADELFTAFKLPRLATVDSEVIPAIVSETGWANVGDALDLLDGGAATALVNEDAPRELILARTQDYPLCYLVTDEVVLWGSTAEAVREGYEALYGVRCELQVSRLDEYHLIRVADGVVGEPLKYSEREPFVRRGYRKPLWEPARPHKSKKRKGAKKGTSAATGSRASRKRQKRSAREAAQALDVWTPQEDAELDYLVSEGFSLDEALEMVLEGQDADWMWVDDEPRIIGGDPPKAGWPWAR